jgi:hypothetical protein
VRQGGGLKKGRTTQREKGRNGRDSNTQFKRTGVPIGRERKAIRKGMKRRKKMRLLDRLNKEKRGSELRERERENGREE